MKFLLKILFLLPVVFIAVSCKQEFKPKILQTDLNYLVVDGFLNNSNETTNIRLSRTKKLSTGVFGSAEENASMSLEDETGAILYNFVYTSDGNYIVNGMNLDAAKKYRLKINTTDGKLYESDLIPVKNTPEIDSVSWKKDNNGVGIYVSTHDPQKSTQYYRWEFTETWEYTSNAFSFFIFENGGNRLRTPDEYIFYCWRNFNSSSLLLGTSAKLSQDIIYEFPVNNIPLNSEQISIMYSILVKQYGLTKECFDYLQNLKKITEEMGSIFDPQPSQIAGNIKCISNPTEPVLGFMTASTKTEKRIFIKKPEVDPWKFSYYCEPPKIITPDSVAYYFGFAGYTPIDELPPPASGYYGNINVCVDCTSRGGSNQKPSFWP